MNQNEFYTRDKILDIIIIIIIIIIIETLRQINSRRTDSN